MGVPPKLYRYDGAGHSSIEQCDATCRGVHYGGV